MNATASIEKNNEITEAAVLLTLFHNEQSAVVEEVLLKEKYSSHIVKKLHYR